MAYVMTYDLLLDSVKRWTIRQADTDYITELPRLVDSTERKVARALKTLMSEEFVEDTFVIGQNLYQKPLRWLETISWQFGSGTNFTATKNCWKRQYEYLTTVYPDPTVQGVPDIFSDFQISYWVVGPAPNLEYPYRIRYYERPQPLDSNHQTNWLTEYAPDLMLYGLLLESVPFLENPDVQTWQTFYDRKLGELLGEDMKRETTRQQKPRGEDPPQQGGMNG